jgi:predicted dehydrogenase
VRFLHTALSQAVGCYAVSAARGVLGGPERVYAHVAHSRNCGVDTNLAATLEFPDGAVAHVAIGFDTPRVERYRVETLNGWPEDGDVFGPEADQSVSLTYSVGGREVPETFDSVDHYRMEVEAFAEAIAAGEKPSVGREETVNNVRTIEALYRSVEQSESVSLPSLG